VTLSGQRVQLARGKANKQLVETAFHELMVEAKANPAPDSNHPTVVSVIEAYLEHSKRHLDARNFAAQKAILKRFAEAHCFRQVDSCKPFHLTQWLDRNPDWESDWTL
jgi:hypothetical protein